MRKGALLIVLGVAFLMAMVGCGGGGGGSSVPTSPPSAPLSPVASFTTSASSVTTGGSLTCTDTSTGTPTAWLWNFGDGATSTLQSPSHTYASAGTYTVTLTASNASGSSSAHFVVVVSSAPVQTPAPTASFTASVTSGTAPLVVNFTDASTGTPTSWLWSFGDGTVSASQNPSHTYATAGTYTASLTAANAGGSNAKSVTITVAAQQVTPPVTWPTLAAIPASDYTETINVAVNQSFASTQSNLLVTVTTMINTDVTNLFGKTTSKVYKLGSLIVYPDTEINNIPNHPEYFHDNNFIGNANYGGTTVVYWLRSSYSDPLPQFFINAGGGTGYTDFQTVSGKTYGIVYLAELATETVLLGRSQFVTASNGYNSYDSHLEGLCHELGHTNGCGVPEWYSLVFSDTSGTLPNLAYNLQALFPQDPMGNAGGSLVNYSLGYSFAPLNSWIINHNANHQLNLSKIDTATNGMTVQVKVTDASGNPVSGATISVYGGVDVYGSAKNLASVIQTTVTDANGIATITNDFTTAWAAKGVKVASNGKYAGAVITALDLQQAYWMQGQTTYTVNLQLLSATQKLAKFLLGI